MHGKWQATAIKLTKNRLLLKRYKASFVFTKTQFVMTSSQALTSELVHNTTLKLAAILFATP
jgi:hypothetical protein